MMFIIFFILFIRGGPVHRTPIGRAGRQSVGSLTLVGQQGLINAAQAITAIAGSGPGDFDNAFSDQAPLRLVIGAAGELGDFHHFELPHDQPHFEVPGGEAINEHGQGEFRPGEIWQNFKKSVGYGCELGL